MSLRHTVCLWVQTDGHWRSLASITSWLLRAESWDVTCLSAETLGIDFVEEMSVIRNFFSTEYGCGPHGCVAGAARAAVSLKGEGSASIWWGETQVWLLL